ncbi:hypothetical protein CFP56_040795 [Quercus suber]|uniref:Uncharacterized protein n=1 Tax=Quercus suber TaxID=58331 RepID=A0AAW0LLQ7_QUESU
MGKEEYQDEESKARSEPIKIFPAKDIQQATNNYDPNLILGSVITTVYKGTLDEREVAIKSKALQCIGPLR